MTPPAWASWFATHDHPTLRDGLSALKRRHGRLAAWLTAAIYLGGLAAFITDINSANSVAFGVFYTPLVATALFNKDRRTVWALAALACVLNIVGAFLPHIAHDVHNLVLNRMLSLVAIIATAIFVWRACAVQDQLAMQTSRAEAAEQMMSDILTNLSQEIRAPLYSMAGVLELISAGGRADQQAALGMVRTAGRRLVSTVDNLVDMTQIERQPLPPETFDLARLLRQTVEAARADAEGRQIRLEAELVTGSRTQVWANPWAVRRIMENLINDAILYTAPGGRVLVRTRDHNDTVCAQVIEPGTRPPGVTHGSGGADIARLVPSVMGLALGQRLARMIGADLTFRGLPGQGTEARLTLKADARDCAAAE